MTDKRKTNLAGWAFVILIVGCFVFISCQKIPGDEPLPGGGNRIEQWIVTVYLPDGATEVFTAQGPAKHGGALGYRYDEGGAWQFKESMTGDLIRVTGTVIARRVRY